MMADGVVVLGAGGHAKVVVELLRENDIGVRALVDRAASPARVMGLPVVGEDQLPHLRAAGAGSAFVAVGDNAARLKIGRKLQADGFVLVNAISRRAAVSPTARLGVGVAIMAGAVVNAETVIDDFAILNTNAAVDHDGRLCEACHVAPGCALAGTVTVGARAFLGVGVRAIPGINVGEGAVVGAGAVLVRDVPASRLALGVPARIVGDAA